MKIISLFSGAGGMDLGFMLAGHEVVWANDFDESAVHSYQYNLQSTYNRHDVMSGDITKILPNTPKEIDDMIPDGDIVIGGFPCQGFSIANVDRNMDDERNFLYLELLKVIESKNPPFFLLENVKGLENMEKGQVLEMILNDLEVTGDNNNGNGYHVYYNVLNALDFGVPQNRERVIIFGVRKDISESFKMPIAQIGDPIKNKNRKRLYVHPTHAKDGIEGEIVRPHEKVELLYKNWKSNSLDYNQNYYEISYNKPFKYTTISDAINDLPKEYLPIDNGELSHHYGTMCKVKFNNRVGNRPTFWDKPSPTIMGRGSGTGGPLIIPHPEGHRRMSIREVARIQTFPDTFVFKGTNSACYRQIGNAVPVLMAYEIAKQIFPIEKPSYQPDLFKNIELV